MRRRCVLRPRYGRLGCPLPLSRVDHGLTLAMADPTNVVAMDEIAAMTRLSVLPVVAAGTAIRAAIERHYTKALTPIADVLAELSMDPGNVEVLGEEEPSVA